MSGYGLTPRQLQALDFVRGAIARDPWPPSVREVAAALGTGVSSAQRLLTELRRRGHIDWIPGARRSLRLAGTVPLFPEGPLAARLDRHCAATGDRPADVIADAVALHLDELEGAL